MRVRLISLIWLVAIALSLTSCNSENSVSVVTVNSGPLHNLIYRTEDGVTATINIGPSFPKKGEIYVDGEYIGGWVSGQTKLMLYRGKHKIRIVSEGYEDGYGEIFALGGKTEQSLWIKMIHSKNKSNK